MDKWLHQRAKEMRREPAYYERRLWGILRDRGLEGLKFRRQVVMGRYVVDFVCLRHRLIVEADGPQHEDRAQDAGRDEFLRGQGFRVLRFDNQRIENRGHEVLGEIVAAVNEGVVRG